MIPKFKTEIINQDNLVLAYFWASWCSPYRLVSPSVNSVAEMYGDRLKVGKEKLQEFI